MAVPKVLDMLATLIGEPSVSCTSAALDQSNLGVINQLANWLDGLGFATEVMPLPDKPGKANLIAQLGGGEGGLTLAGHTDTVPFDDTRWSQNPFEMTERDGRFYGLGSGDMKGFFPLAIAAAAQVVDKPLQAPLTIVATSDEESSMAVARYLTECDRPKSDYAIIGEPTGARPVYAHKGFMMLSITLQGASGHSSNPGLGRNALDAMHSVMSELLAYRGQLAQQYQNGAFEVAVPTMNLGCLRAGDNPNRICADAELQIDLRLLPAWIATKFSMNFGSGYGALQSPRARRSTLLGCPPLYHRSTPRRIAVWFAPLRNCLGGALARSPLAQKVHSCNNWAWRPWCSDPAT